MVSIKPGSPDPQEDFNESLQRFLNRVSPLDRYERLREHIHQNPDLSGCERDTAALIASRLKVIGYYQVHTQIGGHGVAAVLQNGSADGSPTVMLRADMDALPVTERADVPYASRRRQTDRHGDEQPVMHACGHDMHVAVLLATAELFAWNRSYWAGTLILIFQPAEETGSGAQAMVSDGLYDKVPIPDVVLGQHVSPQRAGKVGIRAGQVLSAADSFKVTFHGRGAHGSAPDLSVDPIVMAASAVLRLQTILSREVSSLSEFAVVTVGAFHAGSSENVIPDSAEIKLNVRTNSMQTRDKVLAAVRRIVKAEAEASGADREPEIEEISSFPLTVNDVYLVERLTTTFAPLFRKEFTSVAPTRTASEDFSNLATAVDRPYAFWSWGGIDPDEYDRAQKDGKRIPGNHSPWFKIATQPTLTIGVRAMAAAAMTFLDKGKDW